MNITPIRTRLCTVGEDICEFIFAHVPTLADGSVLVVTSKIVAQCELRVVECASEEEWEKLVTEESEMQIKTKWATLTLREDMLLPNAGIDRSNVGEGLCVLLPKDSFESARGIRYACMQKYGIQKLGVVITDSRVAPLRAGTTALALGYAGIEGVRDYRGKDDLYGREMQISRTNVVDSLATAACLCMGEGSEQQPLAVITGAPVVFTDTVVEKSDVCIDKEDDLYYPLIAEFMRRASS